MLCLSRAEQTQAVMSDALCAITFSFNRRMHMWLQNLLPCAADQPNLEQYCNVKIPIPGWGGNWLEFRQEGGGKPPLMFPILNELGLSMYHASEWAHSLIRLEFCDICKGCPMGQIWVFCAYCRKFQFPAERHRASIRHQKALRDMGQYGAGYCTSWALENCQDRWL